MADAVEANRERPFGGCLVIVPPGETMDLKIIATLVMASHPDPAQFWAMIKGEADFAVRDLDARERQGLAFGHR